MEDLKKLQWDNKFGLIKVEGVGKNAEIVTNNLGGKQSKSPTALYLIDPEFLTALFGNSDIVIRCISDFMITGEKQELITAILELEYQELNGTTHPEALITIGKVLQEGAAKYEPNNWRLIPQEDHLNHALVHYMAYLLGDTQDNHIEHCMCRLMMAYSTVCSKGFSYTKPMEKE